MNRIHGVTVNIHCYSRHVGGMLYCSGATTV